MRFNRSFKCAMDGKATELPDQRTSDSYANIYIRLHRATRESN